MRTHLTWLFLLGLTGLVNAAPLTPSHEPKDNSFYVCYEQKRINYSIRAPLATYRKYKYMGCIINRIPCDAMCVNKVSCPSVKLKLFDWFNNYPQALNAFYRCAYS